MKNYNKYALKTLQESGFKITPQREMIVRFLAKSDKALSPYDIRTKLKKQKITADVVIIYRALETLEKLSLAHKVLAVNGYIRCNTDQIRGKNFCHHYLLCKKCHKLDEVEGEDLTKLETKIAKTKKFRVDSHYLEFTGVCKDCARKLNQ